MGEPFDVFFICLVTFHLALSCCFFGCNFFNLLIFPGLEIMRIPATQQHKYFALTAHTLGIFFFICLLASCSIAMSY